MTNDARKVLDDNVVAALRNLASSAATMCIKGRRTCVHCLFFDQQREVCNFYSPQMRPPAVVIAFGCDQFAEDVPF